METEHKAFEDWPKEIRLMIERDINKRKWIEDHPEEWAAEKARKKAEARKAQKEKEARCNHRFHFCKNYQMNFEEQRDVHVCFDCGYIQEVGGDLIDYNGGKTTRELYREWLLKKKEEEP